MHGNNTPVQGILIANFVNTANYSLNEYIKVTTHYSSMTKKFNIITEWILIIFVIFICIFGFLGNLIVVYIILRKTKSKSNRNWYVLNLAICDILTTVMCIPFTAVRLFLMNWSLGGILCKLVPALQALYVFVSTFTIVAIAADRYKAIISCTNRHQTNSSLVYIFPMLWMTSFALALPMFIYHTVNEVVFTEDILLYTVCIEKWPSVSVRIAYTLLVMTSHFVLPLSAVAVLHILICRFIRMRIGTRSNSMNETRSRRHVARQKKNIVLLTGISVSFAFIWLPWTSINIIADFDYKVFLTVDFHLLYAFCQILAMSSVCINPIVYGWFNSNFRIEIQLLFGREKSTNLPHDGLTVTEAKSNNRLQHRVNTTMYSLVPTKLEMNNLSRIID